MSLHPSDGRSSAFPSRRSGRLDDFIALTPPQDGGNRLSVRDFGVARALHYIGAASHGTLDSELRGRQAWTSGRSPPDVRISPPKSCPIWPEIPKRATPSRESSSGGCSITEFEVGPRSSRLHWESSSSAVSSPSRSCPDALVLCSQSLFRFADLGDDGLCRGGPDKGCGVSVSAIDVVVDRLD